MTEIEFVEPDDDDIDGRIQFGDPYSGQMSDMFISYDHILNMDAHKSTATLMRPRLTIHDLRDMVARPEGIQLFQWRDRAACLTMERRLNIAHAAAKAGRGWIWRQLGDRQLPRAPLS